MSFTFLLGQKIQDAIEYCNNSGISYRISSQNGKPMILTCDYNPGRINFVVKSGVITDIGNY